MNKTNQDDWIEQHMVDVPPFCPVCDNSGSLIPGTHTLELDSGIVVYDLENYECKECNAAPCFPNQIRRNQEKIRKMKQSHVIRYAVAWFPRDSSFLVSMTETRERLAGWYLLKYDDQGREAYVSGPHHTAEDALHIHLNSKNE